MHAKGFERLEEGARLPVFGVTGYCELLEMDTGN